jgi:hypothetical protein
MLILRFRFPLRCPRVSPNAEAALRSIPQGIAQNCSLAAGISDDCAQSAKATLPSNTLNKLHKLPISEVYTRLNDKINTNFVKLQEKIAFLIFSL